MNAEEALEQRYRRLLRLYPRGHRTEYEAEMLGVLLDASPEGRRHPTIHETADLVGEAARLHLRNLITSLGGPVWGDAAALTSVLAPLLLATAFVAATEPRPCAVPYACGIDRLDGRGIFSSGTVTEAHLTPPLLLFGSLTAAVLVLSGRRWIAAVIAVVLEWRMADQYLTWTLPDLRFGGLDRLAPVTMIFVGGLAVTALCLSPGPARALEILGRRRILAVAGCAVAFVVAEQLTYYTHPLWWWTVVGILAVITLTALHGPAGRRALAFLAPSVGIAIYSPLQLPRSINELFTPAPENLTAGHGILPMTIVWWLHLAVVAAFAVVAATACIARNRRSIMARRAVH